jgi:hypothetical protein
VRHYAHFICKINAAQIAHQVESQLEGSGLVVAGLYHAHDNLRDTHIDVFSQRIADKVPVIPGLWIRIDSIRIQHFPQSGSCSTKFLNPDPKGKFEDNFFL